MTNTIYTIGHSNHSLDKFVELLKQHGITVVADVRSAPYSRFHAQFNKEELKHALRERGLGYVFLGRELGARSNDPGCYENGRVRYDRLAETKAFKEGVERLRAGVQKGYCIALMCAEKDPAECHRAILVSRRLHEVGFEIRHILADGRTETQEDLAERLVEKFNLKQSSLFDSVEDPEAEAYRKQEEEIAYRKDEAAERKAG